MQERARQRHRLLRAAILFWLFVYTVQSAGAGLLPGNGFDLLTPRRALATTVGAVLFLAAARSLLRPDTASLSLLPRILRWSLGGALLMLLTLTAIDYVTHDFAEAEIWSAADNNALWVLTWLGYFTASLLAILIAQTMASSASRGRPDEGRSWAEDIDVPTVRGFGQEWSRFDQSELDAFHRQLMFEQYFSVFPIKSFTSSEGFDVGCGSGRWAKLVAPAVRKLHCIDPAPEALEAARRNLAGHSNVQIHQGSAENIPLAESSQDFGYSLGVLHHVPNPLRALECCVRKLKPGAPFLIYVYYNFENRPAWFKNLWRVTDRARWLISRLPFTLRLTVTEIIAAGVYYPAARTALIAEKLGFCVRDVPLSAYRSHSFYTMRTDALDRFGTRLEHRFSRADVEEMMIKAGLENIRFSQQAPFWVACGTRRREDRAGLN